MGVGTTGYARNIDGELFTLGTVDARFRFYPSLYQGFFITFGGGLGSGSYAGGESELGLGIVAGLGWDVRLSPNVSLTPFWNGVALRNSTDDANFGQLGLGITIH